MAEHERKACNSSLSKDVPYNYNDDTTGRHSLLSEEAWPLPGRGLIKAQKTFIRTLIKTD